MTEIKMKFKNTKQLVNVLKDIKSRATLQDSFLSGYEVYYSSITTLIKVLEEGK